MEQLLSSCGCWPRAPLAGRGPTGRPGGTEAGGTKRARSTAHQEGSTAKALPSPTKLGKLRPGKAAWDPSHPGPQPRPQGLPAAQPLPTSSHQQKWACTLTDLRPHPGHSQLHHPQGPRT